MLTLIEQGTKDPDDRAFMIQIYHTYERLMYYTANKHCTDAYDREEIVQDTLLKLIEKVALLRTLEKKALTTYVTVAVRNTAFSRQRRRAKEETLFAAWMEEMEQLPDPALSLEEGMILAERRADLAAVWDLLSEEDRFLLEGRYILGYADSELAQQLGGKTASVRMRLTRARRRALSLMRKNMEGDADK